MFDLFCSWIIVLNAVNVTELCVSNLCYFAQRLNKKEKKKQQQLFIFGERRQEMRGEQLQVSDLTVNCNTPSALKPAFIDFCGLSNKFEHDTEILSPHQVDIAHITAKSCPFAHPAYKQ